MEYWKPEHPPPTTPIRSPAGTGVCVAIISRTFAIAAGVRVTGVVEAGAPTTTSGVTVAVDIGKSPRLIQTSLSVCACPRSGKPHHKHVSIDARQPLAIQQSQKHPSFLLPSLQFTHQKHMKFIQFIANAFINTMGITQPSPQTANRAAWFIVIMLSAVLAGVVTIAVVAI